MEAKRRKDKNRKKRVIWERQRDQYVLQLVDSWWGWLIRERISEAYRLSRPDGDYMDLPPEERWAAFLAMVESDRERATKALRDAKHRGLDPSDDVREDNEIRIRVSDGNARKVYRFHPGVYYEPLSVPLGPDTPDHYLVPLERVVPDPEDRFVGTFACPMYAWLNACYQDALDSLRRAADGEDEEGALVSMGKILRKLETDMDDWGRPTSELGLPREPQSPPTLLREWDENWYIAPLRIESTALSLADIIATELLRSGHGILLSSSYAVPHDLPDPTYDPSRLNATYVAACLAKDLERVIPGLYVSDALRFVATGKYPEKLAWERELPDGDKETVGGVFPSGKAENEATGTPAWPGLEAANPRALSRALDLGRILWDFGIGSSGKDEISKSAWRDVFALDFAWAFESRALGKPHHRTFVPYGARSTAEMALSLVTAMRGFQIKGKGNLLDAILGPHARRARASQRVGTAELSRNLETVSDIQEALRKHSCFRIEEMIRYLINHKLLTEENTTALLNLTRWRSEIVSPIEFNPDANDATYERLRREVMGIPVRGLSSSDKADEPEQDWPTGFETKLADGTECEVRGEVGACPHGDRACDWRDEDGACGLSKLLVDFGDFAEGLEDDY